MTKIAVIDTLDYKLDIIDIHCKMFYRNKLIDIFCQLNVVNYLIFLYKTVLLFISNIYQFFCLSLIINIYS